MRLLNKEEMRTNKEPERMKLERQLQKLRKEKNRLIEERKKMNFQLFIIEREKVKKHTTGFMIKIKLRKIKKVRYKVKP